MYLLLATFASLWTKKYGMSVGIGGLNYIALGLGFTIGVQVRPFDLPCRHTFLMFYGNILCRSAGWLSCA